MDTLSYNVGDLKRFIKESSNEFKARLGSNVESENKRNSEKSYKDAEKRVKDFDGGLTEPKKGKLADKLDGNRTTLEYNPITEPDKDYKDKVKAQAQGYTSKAEKENGIEKAGATFDDEGKIYNNFTDARDKRNKEKEKLASSGLQAREYPKESFKKNNLSENMTKRLIFKHTRFLNESNMLQRIPEEYKVDGQKIYMKDGFENEYLVECVKNVNGSVETNIVSYVNKNLVNEQVDRIFGLMTYDTKEEKNERNFHTKINESEQFQKLMNITRNKDIIK